MDKGFISLHRRFLEWEWYSDNSTKILFIHLLIKANYADKKWRGKVIKRGSFLTGRVKLSTETGLTEQQVRTSLRKLKSTNEITIETTSVNSLISITNYDKFQKGNQQNNQRVTSQITNEQPTSNQRVTTTNKDNNINNINKIIKKSEKENFSTPPNLENRIIYSIDLVEQKLKSDKAFIDMQNNIFEFDVSKKISTFVNSIRYDPEKNYRELGKHKSHFVNWLRKNPETGYLDKANERFNAIKNLK